MTQEQRLYIEKLIKDTQKAGELKSELTLKIIVSQIMNKYNVIQNDAVDMCFLVMQNMTIDSLPKNNKN